MTPENLIDRLREAKVNDFELVSKEEENDLDKSFIYPGVNILKTSNEKFVLNEDITLEGIDYERGVSVEKLPHRDVYRIGSTDIQQEFFESSFKDLKIDFADRFRYRMENAGTPPHMERVMAFLNESFGMCNSTQRLHEYCTNGILLLKELWLEIDPTASHDFFWLIENASEKHYEELLKFCKQYIL